MTEPSNLQDHQLSDDWREDEISLLDVIVVLAKHKKLILGLPIVAAAIAFGISLLLPILYTGTTRILPPQQSQSGAAAMLAQLGALSGLAGSVAGPKSVNDLYVGMLKSRTVADNLVQRFDLNKLYAMEYQSDTLKMLEQRSTLSSGKDGIITITVDDKDPKRAAELANAYAEELLKLTKVLAVTEASQRRLFFERQFEQARDNLTKAEAAAREALQKGGLVQVEGQGRAIVEASARLRGQITVKEVQIGAMRTYATDRNPDLLLAQRELDSLRYELSRIEGDSGGRLDDPKANNSLGIGNLGLLRNAKYYETIYELLAKQFELAKIDEAKDSAVVQVLDPAIEPDRKSKPKRASIVLASAFAALFIAILWAFLLEAMEKARANPQQAGRLLDLKRHLTWK